MNLYNGFTLIKTNLYVSHGPFISVYNIISKDKDDDVKWVTHYKFEEGDIVKFMKVISKKDKTE